MRIPRKDTHTFAGVTNSITRRLVLGFALFALAGGLATVSAIKLNAKRTAALATQRYIAPGGTDAGDCSNSGSPCATLAYAVSQSTTINDTINAAAGTYVLSATVNVNVANLTIKGAGSATTIFQIAQAVGNALIINAAGVTVTDLQIQKTDVTGVHELILVNATGDNFTLQNSLIQGPDPGSPWGVNGIVSRALVSSTGGVTGLLIQNNTIKHLRQPAYFNPGTVGTVSNNNVSGTRGWVVDGGIISFTGNTWGPPANQGADIALLASCNPADYPNLVAISTANSNAFISAQFTSAPAAPFNGRAVAHVDDSAAAGGDGTSALPYQTIAAGIGGALFGGTVNVAAGTYTELVNANRSLTFTGVGMPMVMAPAGSNQTIFTIAADNVTIQGFKITVNRPSAAAGIAAIDPSPFNGTQILNNTIQSTGTGSSFSSGCCGNTSAAGIALIGNGGTVENVTIKGNTINSGDATNFFSRAIWLREVRSTVGGATVAEGNTLVATTQDLLNQFASGGTTLVQNNTFNGAGIDFTEPNNSPSTINIQNNQFAPGSPLVSQSCLIKHNYLNVPVNIANNTFTGHTTGIWTGGSQNVTISGNGFTPAMGLASYQNIRVDTAWPGTQVAPFNSNSVSISGNTFNGAAGSSGVGISFRNGQKANTTDPDFSSVTLSANIFNATLTEFMRLDGTSGQEFQNNLDGSTNQYDVGAGLQLPSAMSFVQLHALENKVFHKLDNPAVGLVSFVANTISVSSTGATGSTPTATDNDYTRVNNAVQVAPSGTTIKLNGTFNWAETNAAASWAKGSDGVAGNTDDYTVYVPVNLNNITFTANALGDATIQGPGDLPVYDLEGVLFFDGGDNQNWTISNIRFLDLDGPIQMYGGAGGPDAFLGTKIQNNLIRLPADVADTTAATDSFQNIAIHLGFGKNQTISGNTIELHGGANSNGGTAAEVALQSNTSGGDIYDGLLIENNIVKVLNAQSADPEFIRGIWDNAHGHLSNITIRNNQFLNMAGGNNPAMNQQVGFRITSHSSATSTVKYEGNTVQGANIGFQFRFGPFTGNQPVQLISNTITGNNTGVDVAEEGVALLKFNRIVGNLAAGVSGNTSTQILAENNWWGCNFGPGATGAGCTGATNGATNSGSGGIDANPWLVLELTAGPTTVVSGSTAGLTASLKKNSAAVDTSLMGMGTAPNGTPVSFAGTLGTVMPTNSTTTGAMATSTYTATGVGAGSASTTVDGQTVSQSITVTGALAFAQQPTNTPPNLSITPAVTVQLKDGSNNNIAQTGVSITLALTSGTGTLSGTLTQMTNAAGLATFNNLSIDLPGVKQLTASATNLTSAVSNNFTILSPLAVVYVDDNWTAVTPGADPDGAGPATIFGYDAFATIQGGINGVATGGTVNVLAGTYVEDININRTMLVCGAGPASTTISGAIGGAGSTVAITANNVEFKNFKVTREGNTAATWTDPNLNTAGLSIQGTSITGANIHDNLFMQNRSGIDINNSNGHTVRNNVLTDNRTGLIFRNQTDNLTVVENEITNNWTVGIVFLDGSGGSNVPVQTAINCTFSNNNISANWYGQIVDRQSGGSLPTPGTNLKNFSANWFGTTAPVITTANSTEPGYAAQIPSTVPGGSATAPGGQPDVAGPASANFDLTPLLDAATDTNVETMLGRGAYGFQGSYNVLNVIAVNGQTSAVSRIQEGVNLVNTGGTVKTLAGSYTGNADVNKAATLTGAFTTSGTLGASAAGAAISPGLSPGIINSGDLSLAAGTALNIELAGSTTPGTGHDQISVTGTVNLGGATLNATRGFAPVGGSSFVIINNDGSDPVVGTFAGLAQGASFLIGGTPFQISYTGGSGNDVVLTVACPTISLMPTVLPNGIGGVTYNQTISALPSGGGYTFAHTGGTLPPGLTLMSNGTLGGVPLTNGSFTFTVTATGFSPYACTGSQTYTVTIGCPTIALTPAGLPNGTAGVAYSQAIGATPAGGGYTFAVTTGVLPAGLTLASNGTLAGTPMQSGTFNFRVTTIGFGVCPAFQDYQLTIDCTTITVNPTGLPGGTVGTAYNQTVSASPTGTYNYAVTSGALPAGLSLNAGTGAITGTPTTSGTFNFTITASVGACAGSRSYAVTIGCAGISFTTASPLPAGQAGVAYLQTLGVSPAGSYTFSLTTGNLPSGLTLNPATGVISGTPTATGSVTFTVQAQTANGCGATQNYTLTIGCPTVTVNPATLPNGSTGTAYSQPLSASPAGGNYTFAVTSGSLPTGLNLNSGTGLLSGTPTTNGTFNFTVTATGFGGCTGNRAYSITIGTGSCPTITLPTTLPNGTLGGLYTQSVTASPAGSYSYAVTSGAVPTGTTLYTSIGLLFGYPTAAGSYTFTVTATQGACTASQTYTVLVSAGFASALSVASDFDGDLKSDLSVFRADGNWEVSASRDGKTQTTLWGAPYAPYNDLVVSGDYDGDGKTDPAVFRRGTEYAGYWFIKKSSDGEWKHYFWGLPTDTPTPGDYDGDGKTDAAVWRASDGVWYIIRSSDGGIRTIHWGSGAQGDVPVPGDYDGDGKTDAAVFRKSNGHWYIKRSSDGKTLDVHWGLGTDVPVPGDYDGDAKTDYAVWRASEGAWYWVESDSAAVKTVMLGAAGDVPVPTDYDGDGKADAAVWQAATGNWQIVRSSDGKTVGKVYGRSGDTPVPARRN